MKKNKGKPYERITKIVGYRVSAYNATYERTTFLFMEKRKGERRQIRVLDLNTGTEFIL